MRKAIFLILIALGAISCESQKKNTNEEPQSIAAQKNEAGEWDIEVLDTQYNYFLNAIARPKNMYTETFLKNRNRILVQEWNNYFYSGRYRNIIELPIDYDPKENYGLNFEYKLYQAFAYVTWRYKLKFSGLSNIDSY